jgi:hypothetical protein
MTLMGFCSLPTTGCFLKRAHMLLEMLFYERPFALSLSSNLAAFRAFPHVGNVSI